MKKQKVYIRQAEAKDIQDIMHIEQDAFPQGIRESQDTFIERINHFKNGFLVMELEGHKGCVGYIASEIWQYRDTIGERDFTLGHSIKEAHHDKGTEIYISSMGLLKSVRGKGLGDVLFGGLFENVLPLHPDINSAILIVSADWVKAQRIYGKSGFSEILRVKNFFKPQGMNWADGIVMRKRLGE